MSTTSEWTADIPSPPSRRSHSASLRTVKGSLTPRTPTRSSMHPSRSARRSASSLATSVACCLKTCPTASPTSPATSTLATRERHPKPQWLRKVSSMSSRHILLFRWKHLSRRSSDCRAAPALLGVECPVSHLQRPPADLDDTARAAGGSLPVTQR